jgi:hypothetical protein
LNQTVEGRRPFGAAGPHDMVMAPVTQLVQLQPEGIAPNRAEGLDEPGRREASTSPRKPA